jgi:hypothetical protein
MSILEQVMTVAEIAMIQLVMMSRLFLIIVESNLSHCLWEQVMNLSRCWSPSTDNVKALLILFFGVEGDKSSSLLNGRNTINKPPYIEGHSHNIKDNIYH